MTPARQEVFSERPATSDRLTAKDDRQSTAIQAHMSREPTNMFEFCPTARSMNRGSVGPPPFFAKQHHHLTMKKQRSNPEAPLSCPILLILLCWILLPTVHSAPPKPLCDPNIFGKPQSTECHTLLDRIIPQVGTSNARTFVEQQFNVDDDGSWPEVPQTSAAGPVQLPKIYTMS